VRPVEPFGAIPPARKFQGMSALAAAEIKDLIIGLEVQDPDDPVDLTRGDPGIFDNVAISLEVEVVEDTPPPRSGLYILLQIRDRPSDLLSRCFPHPFAIGRFIAICLAVHACQRLQALFPE